MANVCMAELGRVQMAGVVNWFEDLRRLTPAWK
jgi:hypothetical protein